MPKSNKKLKKIYMDYAASAEANPSSIHLLGVEAKTKLENARKDVASILSTRPNEVIFTSGGTESNNLAIFGCVSTLYALPENSPLFNASLTRSGYSRATLPHIVTTNIEHPSVLETCRHLEKTGQAEVTYIPVEANGIVDPKKIGKAIKSNTVLVSVMYANNEIGTVQPLREIAKEIRFFRKTNNSTFPLFHTDAVQAVNYLDLNIERLGVDLMSLSGSKIERSGRIGILYKKTNVKLESIFFGGAQEGGLRPGTENLPAILEFAKAFKIVRKDFEKENKKIIKLRDYFVKKIKILDKEIIVNGDEENRLPNNVNITVPKIPSDLLVIELSKRGIYISEKSACKSMDKAGSYVIEALRIAQKSVSPDTKGSLRFSFGKETTKSDIDHTLKYLAEILTKLKRWYN